MRYRDQTMPDGHKIRVPLEMTPEDALAAPYQRRQVARFLRCPMSNSFRAREELVSEGVWLDEWRGSMSEAMALPEESRAAMGIMA